MKKKLTICIVFVTICVAMSFGNKTNAYIRSEGTNNVKTSTEKINERQEKDKTKNIFISAGIGAAVSTIICFFIGLSHRPVKTAKTANNYVEQNSIDITDRNDELYDSVVNRTARSNK